MFAAFVHQLGEVTKKFGLSIAPGFHWAAALVVFRILRADCRVAQRIHQITIFSGYPEHFADRSRWHFRSYVDDEVAFTAAGHRIEDLIADLADFGFVRGYRSRRKAWANHVAYAV